MEKDIPEDITQALEQAFQQKSEGDDLARCLHFLSNAVIDGTANPYKRSLKVVINRAPVFKNVAQRLANDTKTAEKDPKYKQFMYDVWNMFLRDDDQECETSARSLDSAYGTFLRAISNMSKIAFDTIREVAQAVSTTAIFSPSGALEAFGSVVATLGTAVVKIGLIFAHLASEIVGYIKSWWTGQISGAACLGSIMLLPLPIVMGLAGVAVGATVGSTVGAAVGAVVGPAGMAVGGAVGAVVGGYIGGLMAAPVVEAILGGKFFNRPKHEALQNAYAILGVSESASNTEVNSAFRHKALECHPDKHPDKKEEWMDLQYAMTLIRVARGEA